MLVFGFSTTPYAFPGGLLSLSYRMVTRLSSVIVS